jgi:hypothetical protein
MEQEREGITWVKTSRTTEAKLRDDQQTHVMENGDADDKKVARPMQNSPRMTGIH